MNDGHDCIITHQFLEVPFNEAIKNMPENVLGLQARDGLIFFLIGIAIMNIPTHITNMSVWQRISGASDPETVTKGFSQSIWSISFCWGLLALIACFAYALVNPADGQHLLTALITFISGSTLGKVIVFVITLGLYGAMLSTASTNLLVVTHTLSEDVFASDKQTVTQRVESKKSLFNSRVILFLSALIAIFLVEGLKIIGFSIADLVFAIYGGALALFPLVIYALLSKREPLRNLSSFASGAVVLGFVSGWATAIYGKVIGDGNLIFLSPTVGILISGLILFLGTKLVTNS